MNIKGVIDKLIEEELTISSIESLTGGLFASTLTEYSGVSKIYKGSVVSYATEIKEKVVGIDKEIIQKYGVVSKECAYQMAICGQKIFDTNICVSFTGNAGPDVMEGKEVGLVYVSIVINGKVDTYELNLSGTRNEIRKQCVNYAFDKIFENLSRIF